MKSSFLTLLGLLAAAIASPVPQLITRGDDDWLSPQMTLFTKPLVLPTVLQPLTTYVNSSTQETFDYYEMTISALTQQIYPNLQATNLQGYNGEVPGPLIKATVGRRSVVRFINQVPNPASIHLHGSPSRPVFDGWAEDTIATGEYKDYVFPNHSPRTLWYHDHAVHITAVNAFYGQAGSYVISDPVQEAALGLPQGKYDIPLTIVDRIYRSTGQLVSPENEDDSYYGDVIHVNGVPWPYLNVEPRKYRFRMLDASLSRSYKVSIQRSNGVRIPMVVVAGDSGYLEHPVSTTSLILGIAERYEIIVDFSSLAGQTLHMRNPRDFSRNEDYAKTDYIMQFRVGNTVTSTANNGAVPQNLVTLDFPTNPAQTRHFEFEHTDSEWRINDIGFADVNNRILAKPVPGSVERWTLENGSGGWAHPIHIHLIDFKVLSRSERGVEPYESGFKDTVFLDENEVATVIARFHPWSGQYMFHCHNLVHEDGDMMAVFDVGNTKAAPVAGDIFSNPMEPTFRAKPYNGQSIQSIQNDLLPWLASLDIYPME